MPTENIVITIREDGTREVARNIRSVGTESLTASRAVDTLKGALRGLVGALAINELRKYADVWTQVRGKVNIFTHSAEETTQVMDRLFTIAQNTRQPLAAVGDSFHQMSIAAGVLGSSQEQLLTATQAIGNAFAVQGTSANTARGGLIQFGQAMTEGIVRAQEYNSMINSMPLVLKTVANNLDGVGGSLAKLRKLMLDKKLFSKDFFAALIKGAPELAALFDKSGKTIGQSVTIMDNALTKYIGRIDETYKVSAKIYDAAKLVADNIDLIAKSITILISPFILQGLLAVARGIAAIGAAALANPFIAAAAAITMAITALTLYRNEIILIEEGQVSLGDYMVAAWERIGEVVTDVATWIGDKLPSAIEKAMGNIIGFKVVWTDLSSLISTIINGWIGWFVSLPQIFLEVWKNIPGGLYNIFVTAFNSIKGQAADFINGLIDAINPILSKANLGEIAQVSFQKSELEIVESWGGMAKTMSDILKKNMGTDYVGKELDTLTEKAKKAALARHEAEKPGKVADLSIGGPGEDFAASGKGAEKAAKELMKLEKELANVVSAASPAEGAILKLRFAEDILAKALEKGLLTRDKYNKYLSLTREHYAEIANPMGELLKKIKDEEQALGLNARAREVETKALTARRELIAKGIPVDEKDLQMLRDRYTALQRLGEIVKAQDALLASSVDKRREFTDQLVAMKKLLDDPTSGFSKSDGVQALFKLNPDAFAGTQTYVDNVIAGYKDMFTQIDEMRKQDIISQQQADQMRLMQTESLKQAIIQAEVEASRARLQLGNGDWVDGALSAIARVSEGFTTLQAGVSDAFGSMFTTLADGFANSAAAAIMQGESLGDTLNNVANQAVEQLISALIKLGIQWAVQAALGATLGASTTAASIAMAGTTAAAWAPAAAAVSLVSFGANSVPAMAGIASTYGLTQSLSLVGMAHDGMDTIPKEGTWLLDQGERVVDRRTNGDLKNYLSDAASGKKDSSEVSRRAAPTIIVNNTGTPQEYQVESWSEDEIRLIAGDVAEKKVSSGAGKAVARDLRNPNSGVSKSIGSNTMTKRRR